MELLVANAVGKAKVIVKNGREWLVGPMVMINCDHGVLAGSKGPLLYTPEDTAKAVRNWNNVPITLDHPYDEITGAHLSAKDAGVWDRQGIGVVKNARFEGSKLKGEAWLDLGLMKEKAPDILNFLREGHPVELSTGLYTENEEAPAGAVYNGKPFQYYARNHSPDHLAILSFGVRGACSINDGCGVLVNKNGKQPTANGRGGNPKPCDDGT